MKKIKRKKRRGGVLYWIYSCLLLILVLILPSIATTKVVSLYGCGLVIAYLSIISATTTYAYWSDKKKARLDLRRTPESTLHLFELLGGWPAAFFSQRIFRHKISKTEYQVSFWLIALTQQYASFDYILNWRYTKMLYQFAKPYLDH
ncbi:MAG: DUF1294 domain-containing protein [Kiritimatiellaceae bacterium]|nr:DUF1294 domain-containing protein [Kiritimatiellaceae bacterium]